MKIYPISVPEIVERGGGSANGDDEEHGVVYVLHSPAHTGTGEHTRLSIEVSERMTTQLVMTVARLACVA